MFTDEDDALLNTTLAELVGLLVEDEPFDQTLARVVRLAVHTVPGCAEASVTLLPDEPGATAYTVVATGDLVRRVDETQYAHGGPCVDTARTGNAHVVPDVAVEPRWPEYAADAARAGLPGMVSLPLHVGGRSTGALNLYAAAAGAFPEEPRAGTLFATQAAIAIANARIVGTSRRLAEQLRAAMATRAVIEQAKGILMAQRRCDDVKAFDLLRSASQRENRKLRDVAHDLVAAHHEHSPA